MKILIVDDEADYRNLIAAMLHRAGHQSILAANGLEALQKLEQERVDLIISDILMPQMDGYQLCREIQKRSCVSEVNRTGAGGNVRPRR